MTRSVRSTAGLVLIFAGIVACAALLWRWPLVLSGAYALVTIVLLLVWKEPPVRVIYLAAALLGPAAEYVAVKVGAWSYAAARWSLPLWLPFAWGLTAVIMLRICQLWARVDSSTETGG